MPTLYMGTERERPEWMLESLGVRRDQWVVGMDFPTATWKSHYYQEHLFGLVVASTLEMLISQAYKVDRHRERPRRLEPAADPGSPGETLQQHHGHDRRLEAGNRPGCVGKGPGRTRRSFRDFHHAVHREGGFLAGKRSSISPLFPRGACRFTIRISPSWTGRVSASIPAREGSCRRTPGTPRRKRGRLTSMATVKIFVRSGADNPWEKKALNGADTIPSGSMIQRPGPRSGLHARR